MKGRALARRAQAGITAGFAFGLLLLLPLPGPVLSIFHVASQVLLVMSGLTLIGLGAWNLAVPPERAQAPLRPARRHGTDLGRPAYQEVIRRAAAAGTLSVNGARYPGTTRLSGPGSMTSEPACEVINGIRPRAPGDILPPGGAARVVKSECDACGEEPLDTAWCAPGAAHLCAQCLQP